MGTVKSVRDKNKTHRNTLMWGALFSTLLLIGTHVQALPIISADGMLLGATDIDVDGTLWDVEFKDGSFDDLFGDASGLEITSQAEAQRLSEALLNQVLLDSADGRFDSDPELTRGCENTLVCFVWTPWGVSPTGNGFSAQVAINRRAGSVSPDLARELVATENQATDFTGAGTWVFGDWSRSTDGEPPPQPTPVSEPSTLSLLALFLGAYVLRKTRRRSLRDR